MSPNTWGLQSEASEYHTPLLLTQRKVPLLRGEGGSMPASNHSRSLCVSLAFIALWYPKCLCFLTCIFVDISQSFCCPAHSQGCRESITIFSCRWHCFWSTAFFIDQHSRVKEETMYSNSSNIISCNVVWKLIWTCSFWKFALNIIAINFANTFSINLNSCILSDPNVAGVPQSPLVYVLRWLNIHVHAYNMKKEIYKKSS